MQQKTFKIVKQPKKRTYSEIANEFVFLKEFIKKYPEKEYSRFHNHEQQRREFFKRFIFKYYVPDIIYTDCFQQGENNYGITKHINEVAREWLWIIVAGGSFAKSYKNIFTSKEAHYICSNNQQWQDAGSFNKMIYFARCQAREFSPKMCNMVSHVFYTKFGNNWKHKTVLGFLDFIALNKDYNWEAEELADICDFVRSEMDTMMTTGRDAITFSGRTINSVIELSNIWHQEQTKKKSGGATWSGLPIADALYETNDDIWEIKQILNSKRLINEGRKQHHCVGSYESSCISGRCGIFSMSRLGKIVCDAETAGTIEVSSSGSIVQFKGKCNKSPSAAAWKILNKWCKDNHLTNYRTAW
jgi:hypothetical protein